MTKLHSYQCAAVRCPHAGRTVWTRTKPPKIDAMVYKIPVCAACRRPLEPTGQTFNRYSTTELL